MEKELLKLILPEGQMVIPDEAPLPSTSSTHPFHRSPGPDGWAVRRDGSRLILDEESIASNPLPKSCTLLLQDFLCWRLKLDEYRSGNTPARNLFYLIKFQLKMNKPQMKKIAGFIVLALLMTGLVRSNDQPADYQSLPEFQWSAHFFENAGIQHVNYPPYEISDFPRQMESLGLDGDRILFGRRFSSFSNFKEAFEKALADNPVETEPISSWEESWHQGVSVQTRLFRLGDKGIAVSFYRPNVIFADLGPYDEAMYNKNQLVEKNR